MAQGGAAGTSACWSVGGWRRPAKQAAARRRGGGGRSKNKEAEGEVETKRRPIGEKPRQ